MRMYNVHQDAKKLNYYMHQSPSYSYDKNELEALSISASKTPSGQINISIVNIDLHKSQKIALEIRGEDYTVFESEILKGKSIDDHNSFENPNKVIPTKLEILKEKNDTIELVLPPQSVVMIKGNK
jgi:alpha-N-arabinofuranosidase